MDDGPFRKNLEQATVFNSARDEEQQSQLFYHIYIVLKPNEEYVNEATRALLQRIEELVPDKTESNLHGEELSERICMRKFGFTKGKLQQLDDCDETPTSIQTVINSTFPSISYIDRHSPESDVSSGIESDLPETISSNGALPAPLHLISRLKIPSSSTSADVLRTCRSSRNSTPTKRFINNVFENGPKEPILPEMPPKSECLRPKTTLIYVKNKSDAMNDELRAKCLEAPICVMRDLVHATEVDLSKFTTKRIEMIAQDYEMDLREQWSMKEDTTENGKSWFFPSFRYRTNVGRYSRYQADSFAIALKNGHQILKQKQNLVKSEIKSESSSPVSTPGRSAKKRKRSSVLHKKDRIYFGTNVDFSEPMFNEQIAELQKLPPFCRLADETNFLSHLGYDLKGMNTAQFYMKIPGCRTPAHLENNSFCSVNLNIGPGDCLWFGVSYEFYPLIDQLCKKKKLDFLKDSWWPDYDELIEAGIPVYRFVQKTGDLVWISGGCVHWVEARGWCNNIAWNVGPMSAEQYKLNLLSTEFNRIRHFESLIPMQHLSWNIAKNCKIEEEELHNLLRGTLIRSLAHSQMVIDYVKTELRLPIEPIQKGMERTTTICSKCMTEVFNIVFASLRSKASNGLPMVYDTFCMHCAKTIGFKGIEVWQVYEQKYLCEILDRF